MSGAGLIVAAYLAGSIPFSYLVVRALRRIDVRDQGSGNAGATNVLRATGPLPAVLVLLLDIAKGAVPVLAGVRLGAPTGVVAAAALAAVLGHVFPIFLGFRGGKGVATALGALTAMSPIATGVAVVVLLLVVILTRFVSLGSIIGVLLVPLLMVFLRGSEVDLWSIAGAAAIGCLVVAKHSDNIERLRAGTERRLGEQTS